MVDEQITDIEQMLINRVRKLERAIAAREQEVVNLENRVKRIHPLDKRYKRYGREFSFTPGDLEAQRFAITIDNNTEFHCKSVDTSVRIVGQTTVLTAIFPGVTFAPGQFAHMTRDYGRCGAGTTTGGGFRQEYIDFFVRIRDTGSDREWQNLPTPAPFLMSGRLAPLFLPVPARLLGGAEIEVEVDPVFCRAAGSGTQLGVFSAVTAYIVHVSFSGEEVAR